MEKGTFNKVFMRGKNTVFVTKAIQEALKNQGVYAGKIDGIWGADTTKAINKYRKQNKWLQNGKIGKAGLKKLLGSL